MRWKKASAPAAAVDQKKAERSEPSGALCRSMNGRGRAPRPTSSPIGWDWSTEPIGPQLSGPSERVRVLFLVVRLHPKYTGRFRLCEGLRVTSDITAAEAAIVMASTGYATSVYRCYWSVVLVNISSQCSELLHTARACLFPFIIIRKIKALLYDTAIVVGRDDAYRGTVGQV